MTCNGVRIVRDSLIAGALVLGAAFYLSCKTANRAPGVPAAPDGASSGAIDSLYAFTSTAADPDADRICLRFDWGDGDTSDWTDWVQSGQPGGASHSWRSYGSYWVRAQAKDTDEVVSDWSNRHLLSVARSWTRTFGGTRNDYAYSVQPTTDGGYVIVGRTESYGAGNTDVWLIKTDASGNKLWDRAIGGIGFDEGCSVQPTTDGGYVIVGRTDSYGAGHTDVWLIKTDASGNKTWDKTFGGTVIDEGTSVQQTSDGGYIITGYTDSYGAGVRDAWLIKTDASGNKTWDRTLGGPDFDAGNSVQQTSDGGYIIAGVTASYGAGRNDVWLVKTDASGSKVWDRTFGGSNDDYGASGQQTTDGGYIITGCTGSYGAGSDDAWLIKTDASGNEMWSKAFGGSNADYGCSVQQTYDGGYIITGYTSSYGAGEYDVWLTKADSSGNEVWGKTFGGTGYDYGYAGRQTFDGGYIISGYTRPYGSGNADAWLIKTDADGE